MKLEFKEVEGAFLFPMFNAVITDDNNIQATYEVDTLMRKALEDAFKAGQDKEKREQHVLINTEEEALELATFFNKESLSRTSYTFKPHKRRDNDWRLQLMKGDHIIQDHFSPHKSERHTVLLLASAIDEQFQKGVVQGRISMIADGLQAFCKTVGVYPTALKDNLNGHPSFNR